MPDPSQPPKSPVEKESVPLKTLATEHSAALKPEDTVKAAGDRMRELDAATWPVVEDCKLVGTVHGKNPDWMLGGHGHDPETWRVGSIMNREVVFCYEDEDCAHAQEVMKAKDLSY